MQLKHEDNLSCLKEIMSVHAHRFDLRHYPVRIAVAIAITDILLLVTGLGVHI